MASLPKLPLRLSATSTISKQRVYYAQPSGVKTDLLALYQQTAKDLDIRPADVRAFAIVESDEKPFTPSGYPLPRFESGKWRALRRAAGLAPSPEFDVAKNAKNLDARWEQFERMRKVDELNAICAHSFGLFQIMGFNHLMCQCADPLTFLREMQSVEGQFKMFKRFMLMSPALLSAVRRARADQVGFHYNGPQYKRNKYDSKWSAASKAGGTIVWA